MSRLAFISDIHSNRQALTAVMESIAYLDCQEILCLGDLVGYGAKPSECVDLLRGAGARCLLGNHEAMVTGKEPGLGFNEKSLLAAEITRGLLPAEALEFLAGLPLTINLKPDVLLCHGSPTNYSQYIHLEGDFSLLCQDMETAGLNLCFLGHTHKPAWFDGQDLWQGGPKEFLLSAGRRHIINPGSVGQPRDRDPRASFAVWDQEAGTIGFHRVEYDIQAAQADIIQAGLPEQLADRLLEGR
ncbi:MAG: metallophosphatase family protein [Gemmatimonadales bacterium]|nr:metallophosphatase family protein [Gemmatimonadales bacterium]